MARLINVGFEVGGTTNGYEFDNNSGVVISTSNPRTGSNTAQFTSLTSGAAKYVGFLLNNTPYTTVYAQAAVRFTTLPSAENRFFLLNDTNDRNTQLVWVSVDASGVLRLRDEDGQVSGTATVSTGQWYVVEVKVDTSPGAGSHVVEARLNGSVFATSSTRSLSAGVGALVLGANLGFESNSSGSWQFDDVIVNDGSGSACNSYPGGAQVGYLFPTAAGDSNQWLQVSAGAGSTNYTQVVDPTDPTTYIRSTTLNDLDLYNLGNTGIGAQSIINCVTPIVRHRNSTATSNLGYQFALKKGSTTLLSGSNIVPNQNTPTSNSWGSGNVYLKPNYYAYTDPDGAAWTPATLDGLQLGVQETLDNSTNYIWIQGLYLVYDYVNKVAPASPTPLISATTTITGSAQASGGTGVSTSRISCTTSFGTVRPKGARVAPTISCTTTMPPTNLRPKPYTNPTIQCVTVLNRGFARLPGVTWVTIGDSYMAYSTHAGSNPYTAANVWGFNFDGLPEGLYSTVLGGAIWGTGSAKGYTTNGVLFDILSELGYDTSKMTRVETAVPGSQLLTWAGNIPDVSDPNYLNPTTGYWSTSGPAIRNAVNPIVVVSLGGNDIGNYGGNTTGYTVVPWDSRWDTLMNTTMVAACQKIADYIFAQNPNAEVWWVSYPNWHVDDDVGTGARTSLNRYPPHSSSLAWQRAGFATSGYFLGAQAWYDIQAERDRWAETFFNSYTTGNNGFYAPYGTVSNATDWRNYHKYLIGPWSASDGANYFSQDLVGSGTVVTNADKWYWANALVNVNSYQWNKLAHMLAVGWDAAKAAYPSKIIRVDAWHSLGKDPNYPDIGAYHPPVVGLQNDFVHLRLEPTRTWVRYWVQQAGPQSRFLQSVRINTAQSPATILGTTTISSITQHTSAVRKPSTISCTTTMPAAAVKVDVKAKPGTIVCPTNIPVPSYRTDTVKRSSTIAASTTMSGSGSISRRATTTTILGVTSMAAALSPKAFFTPIPGVTTMPATTRRVSISRTQTVISGTTTISGQVSVSLRRGASTILATTTMPSITIRLRVSVSSLTILGVTTFPSVAARVTERRVVSTILGVTSMTGDRATVQSAHRPSTLLGVTTFGAVSFARGVALPRATLQLTTTMAAPTVGRGSMYRATVIQCMLTMASASARLSSLASNRVQQAVRLPVLTTVNQVETERPTTGGWKYGGGD